ncbi:hypothetical protein LguiB_030090 [Lonicera macranthoides]
MSAIYAKCTRKERQILWAQLQGLNLTDEMWFIGGDFNIVRRSEERLGGNLVDFNAMNDFNDFVSCCGLLKFSIIGSTFTWQKAGQKMWQTLDRAFSDHAPLFGIFANSLDKSWGCFKFQDMRGKHHVFHSVVQNSWDKSVLGNPLYIFATKLKRLKKCLIKWNKDHFGNLFQHIKDFEEQLRLAEKAMEIDASPNALEVFNKAKE